jgi:hypothetical protein
LGKLEVLKEFSALQSFLARGAVMGYDFVDQEVFEISARFRQTIEERIAKLEHDADYDEQQISRLCSDDHIRRQMRLVAVERAEARRMRLFLDRAQTRTPRPFIAL